MRRFADDEGVGDLSLQLEIIEGNTVGEILATAERLPGGSLSQLAVVVVGIANLAADGVAMGLGNLLAIRAHGSALAADGRPEEETYPWKHGLATLVFFVLAGTVPLLRYMMPVQEGRRLSWSVLLTMAPLFGVGVARAAVTRDRWWRTDQRCCCSAEWSPSRPTGLARLLPQSPRASEQFPPEY